MKRVVVDDGGDVVEGVVDAVVPGGDGIVRDANGVVFVSRALPGERVRARVVRKQKRVRHAVLLQVLSPSPERVTPDCALHAANLCGGCELLDFSTSAQHQAKAAIVNDALRRVGRLTIPMNTDRTDGPVAPLVHGHATGDDGALGRRRARFVIIGGALTFSAKESHTRTAIVDCPALHPTLRASLAPLRAEHATSANEGRTLHVACDDAGHISAIVVGAAATTATVLVGEVTSGALPFRSDASVFTQATRFGGRAILDEVMRACGDVSDKHVLELFAGAGHLTGPLVKAGAVVDAVEGSAAAVAWLEENLASLSLPGRWRARVSYIDASLDVVAGTEARPTATAPIDVVVADPPRTGIPGFAGILAKTMAPRLVLVSCDPATGARDIAIAVAAGYRLTRLVPIDAFPRTAHVEWVATLER